MGPLPKLRSKRAEGRRGEEWRGDDVDMNTEEGNVVEDKAEQKLDVDSKSDEMA